MKSIMQEASSLAKAIEQGWIKAGKPAQFSIKVLEEPQKNFIGMTTHPARIALYFEEKIELPNQHNREQQRSAPTARPRPQSQPPREARPAAPRPVAPQRVTPERNAPEPRHNNADVAPSQPVQQRVPQVRTESLWTEDMIRFTQQWFTDLLRDFKRSDITFTIEPQTLYLRITLQQHLLDQHDKEKQLLASLSLVLFETLRKKFKTGLRRHKIVITHS